MRIRVLGSAAGGAFPQWNCGCSNCSAVRAGDPRVQRRTQDSLAVTAGRGRWHLINASPDILRQIESTPDLEPRGARDSPIHSIVLSNGDLDHVLGLFSLRESWPLIVYATSAVRRGLEGHNAICRTLRRFSGQLVWRELEFHREIEIDEGLTIEARPAAGKLPVHLTGIDQPSPEDNASLWLRDKHTEKRAAYIGATSSAKEWVGGLAGIDCVFFDGTFWSSDELIRLGLSSACAEDMAHLPIGGEGGSLLLLKEAAPARKIYTHINNSNPILVEGSPEYRAVLEAGCEIAVDGMEVTL
ncbi:MAG: pyrroloquinoline quinone biosynthesis protein PqqB [Polyangiaceae bacterium]